MSAKVYILRCADGSYYVGSTGTELETRVSQITDAVAVERQLKGWSRAKKEALIEGDFGALRILARSRSRSTQDELDA